MVCGGFTALPITTKYKDSCGLNNEIMRYAFEEEFRLDHPETVGETDIQFDLENYKDWLEAQLIEARKQLALSWHLRMFQYNRELK